MLIEATPAEQASDSREVILDKLQEIVAGALGLDQADIEADVPFTELGASSLALVDAFRAITEHFGVRPSIRRVFNEFDTLERLAGYVLDLLATQPADQAEAQRAAQPAALPQSGQALTSLPLSAAQTHLWFLAAYSDGAMLAHTHRAVLQLIGPLDVAALEHALQAVTDRHEALRLIFNAGDAQQIASDYPVKLSLVDLSATTSEEQPAAVGRWLREECRQPFEPAASLWRAALLRLGPERHLLVVNVHALAADEPALRRVITETAAFYSAGLVGDEPRLEPPVPLREYGRVLSEHEHQAQYQRSRVYWSELYADGIPQIDLTWWQSRPPVKNYAGARLVMPVPEALSQSIQAWSAAHKTSPFVTVLAAFQLWLHRLSGQADLVVGVFSQGATQLPRSGTLVANTTNPLPLRTQVAATATFSDHVQTVQQGLLAAFDHQDYPFAAIIHDLNPERDQSRSPIFSVGFDWQTSKSVPAFAGLRVEPVTAPVQFVPYDLCLTVVELQGQWQFQCDYSTELFDAPIMPRWLSAFRHLLSACLEQDQQPAARLPLLAPNERRQLLVDWNDTAQPYTHTTKIHQLFEAQAARSPQAVALMCAGRQLTFAELNQAADEAAAALRAAGVGPGQFVGLCVERSLGMMVGLLAILKTGGAYVPLDPAFPADRLAFMLQDSGTGFLVTEPALRQLFPGYGGLTFLVEDLALVGPTEPTRLPALEPAQAPPPAPPAGGDLALMIYTSGSTGLPKGVPITHRSVVNLLQAYQAEPGLTSTDRLLAVTTLSFDISEVELFLPLVVGATIVLATQDEAADGVRLLELLQRAGVTFLQATPATWRMLLAAGWQGDGRLRMVSGGEALTRELADQLLARGGALWNLYGPTETTIWSTIHRVEKAAGPVPIGRPMANTQVYVLDGHLEPTPLGVPGELYIGGDGVSAGYWRRPELTEERFVPNPFVEAAGGPRPSLYRTGDLVRWLPNGDLAYLGRMDFQVKVKGFRIELGEVESVLASHAAIQRCVVIAREDGQPEKYLAAYFVTRSGQAAPTTADLRAHLAAKLPDYMIPAAFVPLETLPQTPNGKLDRKALPAPERSLRAGLDETYAPPRDRVEETLCRIWGEVLGLERVGIHDNFFHLGGHSLLLTPLVLKLREYFRLRLSMREFFARPTVAELAELIAEARRHRAPGDNGYRLGPAVRQDGPEAKARFDFLREQAQLDPSVQPNGRPYTAGTGPSRLLMTGATGFVGAYMLRDFLEQTSVTLYCLVRAKSEAAGLERIRRQAARLGLWQPGYAERLRIVTGDVSQPRLGLEPGAYQRLAHEVDTVLHSAAVVNFIYPFQAMKAVNVDGVQRVIEFAFEGQVKPVHYLSTTAIWPMGAHRTFTEDMDLDQDLLLNLAYDETKWVAEKMLRQAAGRGLPVAVYRPGEVSGDSRTGASDLSHLASAILKGGLQAGVFPALNSYLDAAPVDYVAQAVVYLMTQRQPLGRAFHLCNPRPMHAHDAYRWLQGHGYAFEVLPFDEWRWRVLASPAFAQNALYPFAALLEEFSELSLELPVWETTATVREFAGSPVACPPLDEALADTYLRYFIESGFLPTAEALTEGLHP